MTQPPQHQPPYQGPYQQQPYQQAPPQPYQAPGPYQQPYQQQPQQQAYQGGYQQPYQGYQQPYQSPPQHAGYQQPQQQAAFPPQQAGYQAPPQGGYQPQGQPGYQPQAQAGGCRVCGSAPAVPVTFHSVVGMIVMHTIWTAKGPYCRDCGLHTFRRHTARTLAGGWCGVVAAILTPIFVILNIVARQKVAALPPPQPHMAGRAEGPLDPGRPLFLRPAAYLYPALLVLVVILDTIGSMTN